MKKNIKDYLHLYLGCEHLWELKDGKSGGTHELTEYSLHEFSKGTINIKPILRPLSDMTEEEKTEIANQWTWFKDMEIVGEEHFNIRHQINHEMVEKALDYTNEDDGDRMSPLAYYQILPYLLKQGFDLFGLIEAGLAIDKTKLNSIDADERSVARDSE